MNRTGILKPLTVENGPPSRRLKVDPSFERPPAVGRVAGRFVLAGAEVAAATHERELPAQRFEQGVPLLLGQRTLAPLLPLQRRGTADKGLSLRNETLLALQRISTLVIRPPSTVTRASAGCS